MNLKIACKSPMNCNFTCLNCPFILDSKHFDKLYNEVKEFDKKQSIINNRT